MRLSLTKAAHAFPSSAAKQELRVRFGPTARHFPNPVPQGRVNLAQESTTCPWSSPFVLPLQAQHFRWWLFRLSTKLRLPGISATHCFGVLGIRLTKEQLRHKDQSWRPILAVSMAATRTTRARGSSRGNKDASRTLIRPG
jgi:hypothetical protein